jgi:hypothetical protein
MITKEDFTRVAHYLPTSKNNIMPVPNSFKDQKYILNIAGTGTRDELSQALLEIAEALNGDTKNLKSRDEIDSQEWNNGTLRTVLKYIHK